MHALLEPLRNTIDLTWLYLFHASWQSAAAGTVVLALVLVGKRWSAPFRYGLLLVALLKFVAPPFLAAPSGVFTHWGPAVASAQRKPLSVATDDGPTTAAAPQTTADPTDPLSQPVASSLAESQSPGDLVRLPEVHVRKEPRDAAPKAVATAESVASRLSQTPISPVVVRPSAVTSDLIDVRFAVLLAWFIGAALATVWLLGQQRRLSRILGRARSITDESISRRFNELATTLRLKRPPHLLRSDSATVPFACGLITRTVVVPGELIDQLPAAQLDVVLAHELAHHCRRDLWVNAVQTLTFVAFWFHPVYWWLTRAIRQVREQCCDDLLLATRLTSADICCETLLTVARRPASPRTAPVAIPMAHPLASRLKRLFDESQKRTSRLSVSGWILTGAAAVLIWPGLRLATPTALLAADGRGATVRPTPSTPAEISGTLMDDSGSPIPNADVYLVRRNPFAHQLDDRDTLLRHGQTDRTGHFQMTVAADELEGPLRRGTEIWAFKDGFAVVAARQSPLKARSPVKLTARRSTAEFVVVGPDGHPVEDALVSPGYVQCDMGSSEVPVPLRARLSRKTDAVGRVTLPVETRNNFHSLTVASPRFGIQETTFVDRQRRFVNAPEKVSLGDVGKIIGHVISDDPAAVADLEVRCIASGPRGQHMSYHQVGSFTTHTNAKGEFQVPLLRTGTLRIEVSENQRFSRLAVPPRDLVVAAGRTTLVEVPLRMAVRVTGRALDRQTRQPVSGVVVAWNRDNHETSTATDAWGQYAFLAHAGQMSLRIFFPQSYVPLADFQPVTIPNAVSDELPPLLLTKGQTLRGRAVDAAGKPVDDVEVEVSWADKEAENAPWGGTHTDIARSGISGDDGSFAVPSLPADRELQIAARTKGVEVAEPRRLTALPDQPFELVVRRLDLIDLSGTVLDAHQHPLRGALAQIEQQCNAGPNQLTMCIVDKVTTDEQGQFRSSRKFDRQGLYRAQILVGGRKVAESEWIRPANQSGNQFPALRVSAITVDSSTLPPREPSKSPSQNAGSIALATSKLDGTVVDSKNRPVANASVIVWSMAQRRRQQTNGDGRFTWPDLTTEGAFLFVEAKDFRFHGQWIVPGKSAPRINLLRRNEPAPPLHAIADPPISQALRERSWRAFQPTLQQLLKQLAEKGTVVEKIWNTDTFDDFRLLELYGEFDPPAALRFIDAHHFKYAWLPDFVRARIAEKLAASAPDESLRVIDQIKDSHQKLYALCRAATLATNRDASLRGQLLARARNELAHVAERWQLESLLLLVQTNREMGDVAAAAEFLKQAESRLQHPGSEENRDRRNFARGLFAIEKAMATGTDTTGLLGPARDNFDFNRYRGAIAETIAAQNPAAAEHILSTLRQPEHWTARICYAMAKSDPEGAARVARSAAQPAYRAYALGLVALVTAPKDRETALRQLDEAYSVLQQAVEAGESSTLAQTPVGTALGMLEIVEQIDPTLVRECLWRAVSLRNNTTFGSESMALGPYGPEGRLRLSDPVLAACLARYDDEAALHALRPPGDESVAEGVERYPHWYFFSSAILDPAGTIDIVARLPRETRTQRIAAESAWRELFASLAHRGEARWDLIREKQMYLWKPGHNDF